MTQLKFEYKQVGQNEWSEIILDQPAKVDIYPNVVHRVTALKDSVMLELNSLQEHIDDTLRED